MAIPEKIKIGDNEYVTKDHPELVALIQEARKDEKTKLYGAISDLEAKMKVLEDEKDATGKLSVTKEAELKKLSDELVLVKKEKEQLEAAKKEDEGDEVKGSGKKSAKADPEFSKKDLAEMLKAALDEQSKQFEEKLSEVKQGLSKKTVGDYRKEQLQKHDGLLIEALVPEGLQTEEEVNKAIVSALETSKAYIQKEYEVGGKKQRMTISEYEKISEAERLAEKERTPSYTPPNNPQKPDQGSADVTGKELLSRIEDMSDAEYAKHADQILREVKAVKYQDQE